MLDCSHCDWMNDDFVQVIAKNSPNLEFLSLCHCYNYTGTSLKDLLHSCRKLHTLLLTGTRIDDISLVNTKWENTAITSLDIRHCARVSHIGVSAVLSKLPRLRYLKCALTDESCRLLQDKGFPEVETLQIYRHYPITIDIACNLLIRCPMITCLDVSSIPFSHVHFQAFLPSMPWLKWICFAANECCGTNVIVQSLAKFSRKLESVWIVYYHCNERDSITDALVELAKRCRSLRTINLTGLYVNDVLRQIEMKVNNAGARCDLEFIRNEVFVLPQPECNLDKFMKF